MIEWRKYADGSQSCYLGTVIPSLSKTTWIADRQLYSSPTATHFKNIGYFPTPELAKQAVLDAEIAELTRRAKQVGYKLVKEADDENS